jgi:hypothetical protein
MGDSRCALVGGGGGGLTDGDTENQSQKPQAQVRRMGHPKAEDGKGAEGFLAERQLGMTAKSTREAKSRTPSASTAHGAPEGDGKCRSFTQTAGSG